MIENCRKVKRKDVASSHGIIPEGVLLFFLLQNYWQFLKLIIFSYLTICLGLKTSQSNT